VELGGVSIITGGIIKYPFDRKVTEHSVKGLYRMSQIHKVKAESAKSVVLTAHHLLTEFDDCVRCVYFACERLRALSARDTNKTFFQNQGGLKLLLSLHISSSDEDVRDYAYRAIDCYFRGDTMDLLEQYGCMPSRKV
jgi:hypothetical protein